MKKRATIIMALMLVLVVALSGCGEKKTAEEIMQETMDKSSEMKNYGFDFDAEVNMTLPETDEPNPMMGMLDSITFNGSGQMDSENMEGYIEVSFDAMGMGLSSEVYFSKEEMLFKVPMMGQWMRMNYAEMAELEGESFDLEAFYSMYDQQEMTASFMKYVDDAGLSLTEAFNISETVKEETVEINGSKVKTNVIEMNIDQATIKKLIPVYMNFFKEVQMPMIADMTGEDMSELDGMDEFNEEEISKAVDEMFEMININTLQIKMYINDDSFVVKEDVNFDIAITDEELMGEMTMSGTVTASFYDINKITSITKPEVDESMIMNYTDMMGEDTYDSEYEMVDDFEVIETP